MQDCILRLGRLGGYLDRRGGGSSWLNFIELALRLGYPPALMQRSGRLGPNKRRMYGGRSVYS